jgi:N-hydroxyarylamine O-acetyltransferase
VTLDRALVERVLERLGFAAAPAPDRAGLAALYGAWCERVPFDNVRKRLHVAAKDPGPLPGDVPSEFFDAWLAYGTGGTCWAGNGALCELLVALGFDAERGVATMMALPDLPPNHATVFVDLDGTRWMVDASILFGEPLAVPITEGDRTSIAHPAWGVVARRESDRTYVRWNALHRPHLDCRIEPIETDAADYKVRHEATRGWSPFNFSISARLNRAGGVVGMGLGQHAEIGADGTLSVRPFATPDERTKHLVETLGIAEELVAELPPDEPLPPPPGSSPISI